MKRWREGRGGGEVGEKLIFQTNYPILNWTLPHSLRTPQPPVPFPIPPPSPPPLLHVVKRGGGGWNIYTDISYFKKHPCEGFLSGSSRKHSYSLLFPLQVHDFSYILFIYVLCTCISVPWDTYVHIHVHCPRTFTCTLYPNIKIVHVIA